MLEELERRNYAASTTRAYLRAVDEFARYFNRPPHQLRLDHIRQYQAYLFRERKLHPSTIGTLRKRSADRLPMFEHTGGVQVDLTAPPASGTFDFLRENGISR